MTLLDGARPAGPTGSPTSPDPTPRPGALTESAWAQGTMLARTGASFVSEATLTALPTMTSEALDALEWGAVEVDDDGVVRAFNRYQSELTGLSAAAVIGRNYFTQVAPCTNNRLFRGAFRRGVHDGQLDLLINYTFSYRMALTEVQVHLYRHEQRNWLLMRRL